MPDLSILTLAQILFVFECILFSFALFSITSHRRRDRLDRRCNGFAEILFAFHSFFIAFPFLFIALHGVL